MAAAISTSRTPSWMASSRFDCVSDKLTLRLGMWSGPGSEFARKLDSLEIQKRYLSDMPREISAGGVVVRQISGVWHVALIEPQKETPEPAKTSRTRTR